MIFKLKVTTARSKVKSRSDHDVAHLQPLTNVPTKYQLPTPYGFRDITRTRLYTSRSLKQGQQSNQGLTMTLLPSSLQPLTNVPTTYHRSRALLQDQRSNQGHTMMLDIYNP